MAEFIRRNARSYVRIRTPERERLLDVLHEAGVTVVETLGGDLEVADGKAERIGELAAQHRIVLHELSPRQASLEEAFMRLTAQTVEYHAQDEAPAPQWGADRRKGN
jgi:ABC-2 type transport system ATP-binding protein